MLTLELLRTPGPVVDKRGRLSRHARDTAESRFYRRSPVGEPDQCWEWQGSKSGSGYGSFSVRGQLFHAHRVAYVLATGEGLTSDVFVLHSCDNPPCVNPSHLRAGTHLENMADMRAKGRGQGPGWGLANPRGRLTDEAVRDIRAAYEAGEVVRVIAERHGVDTAYVSRVGRGLLRAAA